VKAVLCLIATYFSGTPLQRWMSIITLVLLVPGISGLWDYSTQLFMGPGLSTLSDSIAFTALLWMVPIAGILALFFSAGMMPIVFGHFARGRQLHLIPFGRPRLLASAIITLLIVALTFAGVVNSLYASFPFDRGPVFTRALIGAVLTSCPMYLLVWLISRSRGTLSTLTGAMLVIPCLAVPFYFVRIPPPPLLIPLAIGGIATGAGALAFLTAPPWVRWTASSLARKEPKSRNRIGATLLPGNEMALMVGVARPWQLSLGLILPIAVATLFVRTTSIWLCYFMVCSVICGGISSLSVPRSRSLWLRGPWSRSQLFVELEALHWRQSAYCVSVLVVLLVVIGSYLNFPTKLLAIGIPLLLLGAASGTYLGLMMTRSIGWLDASCAIGAMSLMLATALYATTLPRTVLIAVEATLMALALSFRYLAQRRWARLDWMLCRALALRDAQSG
jgi:hypothetical protein